MVHLILLVRHADTEWSASGRFTGRTDVPLSDVGRARAQELGARLKQRLFTGVWSSPSQRAVETARLSAGEPRIDERLSELDFGSLEGLTWDECSPDLQEELLAFDSFAAPEGETVPALRARVESFLAELPPGDHVVFTHGGVIRMLLRRGGLDRRVAPGEVVELPGEGPSSDGSSERS